MTREAPDFATEIEMPGARVTRDQLQIICNRYRFASQFVGGKDILEVGCGPGLGLGYLARIARRVIGGDCTEVSLRRAQGHYRGQMELISLDAHSLPFRNSSFDVVVAMATTIYLRMDNFLDECYRVLRRDGALVFCMPNPAAPGFRPSRLSNRYYTSVGLVNLLSQHHFEARVFGAFPPLVEHGGSWQKLAATCTGAAGKVLDRLPWGRKLKKQARRLVLPVVLKDEIDDEMMSGAGLETIQVEPLDGNSNDVRHRVLYVVAKAKDKGA